MAIPRVNLNLDPEGYAGNFERLSPGSFSIPNVTAPGIPHDLIAALKRQAALRERMAKAQLDAMKQELRLRQRDSLGPIFAAQQARRLTDLNAGLRTPINKQHVGRLVGRPLGPEELGRAASQTLDPNNRLARTSEDWKRLGQFMQFLGPQEVGAGMRTAGAGFASLAGQASANAPALASMQGPDVSATAGPNRSPYRFLTGSPGYKHGSLPELQVGTLPAPPMAMMPPKMAPMYGPLGNRINFHKLRMQGLVPGSPQWMAAGMTREQRMAMPPTMTPKPMMAPPMTMTPPGAQTMLKKGTLPGTVPKTGNYKLHKGEVVVSEPQVDEPLISYLVEDKLRKGITRKNPKGRSYAGGSLGYAMPSVDPALAAALGLDIWGAGAREPMGPPAPPALREPISPPGVKPGFVDWLRSVMGGGGGPSEEDLKAEARARFQAGLPFQAGAIGTELPQPPMSPEQMQAAFSGVGQEAAPTAPPMAMTPEAGPAPGASLEVALSRVRGGDLGTPERPLTLTGSSGLGPNSALAMAPPEGRGDENLPPEERYFAPESPEWRRAQSARIEAQLAKDKADRIHGYLLKEGMNMDPDARRDLMTQAQWLNKIGDTIDERFEAQKARREEAARLSNDAVLKYETELHKASAKGDRLEDTQKEQHLQDIRKNYDNLERMYIDPKNEDGKEEILRAMARNYVAQARLQGIQASPEEAEVAILLDMGAITPDEAEERLSSLGGG